MGPAAMTAIQPFNISRNSKGDMVEFTKRVLVHTCFQHKKGTEADTPLSPKKCRCRQYMSAVEAAKEVSIGAAQYVRAVDKIIEADQDCVICGSVERLKKSCQWCKGTGIVKAGVHIKVDGEDIIRTVSADGKRSILTDKVKKAPTIESNHILRGLGLLEGNENASRDRWDEYELLTLKERIRLLVEQRITSDEFDDQWRAWLSDTNKPFPLALRSEPKDDLQAGTGRRFDYGRPV
jgi:hypothetical protein